MSPVVRMGGVDPETGNTDAVESVGVGSQPASSLSTAAALVEARKIASVSRIQEVIAKALAGTLPRERELRYWEPEKLNARHINIVLDKAAGYTNGEIAERTGYELPTVSIVLNHPDSQYLLAVVLGAASEKVADVTDRLKHLAPEALNVKLDILRNEKVAAAVRDRVATDLLDRAGYGAKKQIEADVKVKHSVALPAQVATGLAAALAESNCVGTVDYRQHLRRGSDDEVAQAADLQLGAGTPQPVAGPLPSESSEPLLERRKYA